MLVDQNPQIPDRVAAIRGDGPSPVPALAASARLLQEAGADFLVIPCNTAHAFLSQVQAAVRIPIIDMVMEVVNWLGSRRIARVGLMATDGTLQAGLYQARLLRAGMEPLLPPAPQQAHLMQAIRGLKAGVPAAVLRPRVLEVARSLEAAGADGLLAGCTELPLMLDPTALGVLCADSSRILAAAAVRWALEPLALPAGERSPAR